MSALPAEEPPSGAVPADEETVTRRLRSHPGGAAAQSPCGPAAADPARQHAGDIWAGPQSGNRATPVRPLFPEGSLFSPNGTWRLPDRDWLFPDGDRVFPGGGRIFSGVNQAAAGRRRVAAGEGGSALRPSAPAAGIQRVSGPVASARRSRPMADVRRASADVPSVPLRLTRRGRAVVAVLAAMVAGGLFVAGASAAQATSGPAAPHGAGGGADQVVVQPGDTLWSIAKSADPGSDTRTVVQEMLDLNRLTGPGIAPGQRLWVPRG